MTKDGGSSENDGAAGGHVGGGVTDNPLIRNHKDTAVGMALSKALAYQVLIPSTNLKMPIMVAQTHSLSTREVETGESLGLVQHSP